MTNQQVSAKSKFLFAMALGAWLNIWPPAMDPWGGFVFAYALVLACVACLAADSWRAAP